MVSQSPPRPNPRSRTARVIESDRGWRTHWRASGAPKQAYSRDEALAVARRISDDDLDNGFLMTSPSAYECSTCGAWHVGNWHYRPMGAPE